MRQPRINKLTTKFAATCLKVIRKDGNAISVEMPDGKIYHQNSTHVRRYGERQPSVAAPNSPVVRTDRSAI